jgi:hypothetical protein
MSTNTRSFELKKGSTRSVILLWKWAVKIPTLKTWKLFLHGLLANMQEVEFSAAGWPELCPVVFSLPGGFVTVMRRANPLTEEEWLEITTGEDKDHIEDLIRKEEYEVPIEEKIDSFGWLDGKLVAVDYGS